MAAEYPAFQSVANSCTDTLRCVINTASNNYKTLLSRGQGPVKGKQTLKSDSAERENVAAVKLEVGLK